MKCMSTSLTVLLLGFQLAAQVQTGAISGYVLDPSARAIPNAAVAVENASRMLTRSVHSDSSGYYEFDGLPPAQYRLSVTVPAFAPLKTTPVRVEVDQRVRLDLHPRIA